MNTPAPRRDAYQRHLKEAISSLVAAARLNPNEEAALLSIVAEIEAVMLGVHPADTGLVRMVARLLGVMSDHG